MSEFVRNAIQGIRRNAEAAIAADQNGDFETACVNYEKAARDSLAVVDMPNADLLSPTDRVNIARAGTSYANRAKALRQKKPVPTETVSDLNESDLFVERPNVPWDDIVGCDDAKATLKQIITYLKQPQAFRDPPKGCLLYGPPGTGKTMLARALATEAETSFMPLNASQLVSKWQGDSEKNMRRVFEIARSKAPTIMFIDEADAILGTRGDSTESASINRMKTEFMMQVDGFSTNEEFVFVMAATNFPENIDDGCMRRLTKSVFVALPSFNDRIDILAKLTGIDAFDLTDAATATDFYSGSNLKAVAQEAQHVALAEWFRIARWVSRNGMWHGFYDETVPRCCADSKQTCACGTVYMAQNELPRNTVGRPVPTTKHVATAIGKIVPETDQVKLNRYLEWRRTAEPRA